MRYLLVGGHFDGSTVEIEGEPRDRVTFKNPIIYQGQNKLVEVVYALNEVYLGEEKYKVYVVTDYKTIQTDQLMYRLRNFYLGKNKNYTL